MIVEPHPDDYIEQLGRRLDSVRALRDASTITRSQWAVDYWGNIERKLQRDWAFLVKTGGYTRKLGA